MNGADSIRISRLVPAEETTPRLPHRRDSVEMAGPASHAGMSVMGCFFIMGPVTLSAATNRLIAVAEFRGLWMADHAGNIRVGR